MQSLSVYEKRWKDRIIDKIRSSLELFLANYANISVKLSQKSWNV